ncbi:MAG: tRNA dihydrouridine synthase DusB [Verrucomicrobiales bacterium]|nr:tRNA dihydrouridine synthase DusB [Verrucomicrobiales bacterium]
MLPWFDNNQFPLYLAPMAGVTDFIFRKICKEMGADVMVTEFVSAEGILHADKRTRKYTEFEDQQRPLGIQLFGADGSRMAEAAHQIIDWKQPDFIDLNFGCPVKKVVSKNGGSSLLRDCPLLAKIAGTIAKSVGDRVPVTAKIRIGWDMSSINAPEVCHILEDQGIQAIAVHGRTRSQGYSGEADWDTIDACARAVSIPVIGNGDIQSAEDVKLRRSQTAISGVMIGRAAMGAPWIFREIREALKGLPPSSSTNTSSELPSATLQDRWFLILRHVRLSIEWGRYGNELQTLRSMRSRLMAYSRGFPAGKPLRLRFSQVSSLKELEEIAAEHLQSLANS